MFHHVKFLSYGCQLSASIQGDPLPLWLLQWIEPCNNMLCCMRHVILMFWISYRCIQTRQAVPPFMTQSISANTVIHWTQKPVTVARLLTTGYKLNYNKKIFQGLKETLLHKNTWEWYKIYVKINHQHRAVLLFLYLYKMDHHYAFTDYTFKFWIITMHMIIINIWWIIWPQNKFQHSDINCPWLTSTEVTSTFQNPNNFLKTTSIWVPRTVWWRSLQASENILLYLHRISPVNKLSNNICFSLCNKL